MEELIHNYTVGLPIAASTFAAKIDQSLHILHIGMFAIFILWAIFMTFCLIRFRKGAHPVANHGALKAWTVRSFLPDAAILTFELWLVFFLGLPIWSQVKDEFPAEDQSHLVQLVAEQFAWNFQYPGPDATFGRRDPSLVTPTNLIGLDLTDPAAKDDIMTINELYVPLGKPTIVYMTSKDVIHSFFVPEFRVKQDTVPGMRIPLWFEPTQAGSFELVCSQLCGLGHYRMKGIVRAYSPEEYDAQMKQLAAAQQETVE